MEPIDKAFRKMNVDLAIKGGQQIEQFFAYQGRNQAYYQKARIGAVMITSLTRMYATETNREALRLAATRQTPALGTGSQE